MNRSGLIMPCVSHRFAIFVYEFIHTAESSTDLTSQIVTFEYNFLTREITLTAREDVLGTCSKYVERLANATRLNRALELRHDVMDGPGEMKYPQRIFSGVKMIDHRVGFDYAEAEAVRHTIVFSYDRFSLKHPE